MLRVAFALLFGWILPLPAQAQPMGEAAQQMAARISSLLQRRATVSLEFQNLTQLPPADSSSFRSALEEELRKAGLEMANTAQPDFRLRVTASENVRGLLFVAEAASGDNRQVTMLPWNLPPRAAAKPRIRIAMQPIWEQAEPVLDLLLLDSGSTMLVLGPAKVSNFRMVNGKWNPAGGVAISMLRPLPRDPRGRLELSASGFRVYLPDATCSGVLQPDLKLTCSAANERWPLGGAQVRWQNDRNLLESDSPRGPFYTVAVGLLATAEGRIQDRNGEQVSGADGWGSDVVSVDNPCGADPALVVAKAGDGRDHDEVQAYEMVNGLARAASEPVSLPGAVTALWPAESRGQATLVIRDSKTGNYAASRLGLACAE
ncbi:MAG TPA: hypothetical protein VEU96_21590 [Bryobacteraceae bacterium]|nr:hypothetical protein [Bryobacteraceae bacterium]